MGAGELDWTPNAFDVAVERRIDGSILLRPTAELAPYPVRVLDALEHWADRSPDVTFVARRTTDGQWRRISYVEALHRIRRLAGGLSHLALSVERPLLILSGNSIEHLLLGLAAMYLGVPYCPVSPAYSQARSDLSKLHYVMEKLTPGLVAAFGGQEFARALETTVPKKTPLLVEGLPITDRTLLSLEELESAAPEHAAAAHANTNADTIAKFLLTSGSAGQPKPVITTNRMLCSNQIMLREALPFVAEQPPVLVDWLPWNHTFGGSHNVGLVLFNGGSLYIDDGRPMPNGFDETVRNLREISPTVYFNVPKGFELLADHLRADRTLRENFYRSLRACFFAGASLAQHTWDALDAQARQCRRRRVPMLSGLGATETGPSVTFTTPDAERAGVVGRPAAGNLVKLAPLSGKLELRVKGPNVTPGYWRLAEQTRSAFDEEGFYRLGDAVRLLDPLDPTRGLIFDGRVAEDFKLSSGTWVSVGPLRLQLLTALAPYAQDVVIAGLDRDYIAILIVPDLRACAAALALKQADPHQLVKDPELRRRCIAALKAHGLVHPGNSTRVLRAVLLDEPLSLDRGEITDKGSVNQRAVLKCRDALVTELYALEVPAHVLRLDAA
jgi:feruloyl-CoA synthase